MEALRKHARLATVLLFAVINTVGLGLIYRGLKQQEPRLIIERLTPENSTKPECAIEGQFNLPMVDYSQKGAAIPPELIRLAPEVEGEFRWKDTRTFYFAAAEPLEQGMNYELEISPQLVSLTGVRLDKPHTHRFHTEPLRVRRVEQQDYTDDGRLRVRLELSEQVAIKDLRRHLRVSSKGSPKIDFELRHVKDGLFEIETEALKTIEPVLVAVEKGLVPQGRELGLPETVKETIKISSKLQIWRGYTSPMNEGWNALRFNCNHRIDAEPAKEYVKVAPKVDFVLRNRWSNLELYGDFKPETTYRVTFLKGLPARNKTTLSTDIDINVRTREMNRTLRFESSGMYMLHSGNHLARLRTINTRELALELHRIYPNNVLQLWQNGSSLENLGERLYQGKLSVAFRKNEAIETDLDLRKYVKGPPQPGHYVLTVRDARNHWPRRTQRIVVTDLGLHAKTYDKECLVWVNSLRDANAVDGAKVSIYSRKNQLIGSATTNAAGLARVAIQKHKDDSPKLVHVSSGSDSAFLDLQDSRLDVTEFDVAGRSDPGEGFEAFVYTERGVYRPGEALHIQALVRDGKQQAPKPFPVELQLFRHDGKRVTVLKQTLSKFGCADFSYMVNRASPTGRYRAVLKIPGQPEALGQTTFRLEDFMPDRIKVAIDDLPKEPVREDKQFTVVVNAEHYFGGPVVGRKVSLRGSVHDKAIAVASQKGYRFERRGTFIKRRDLDFGTAKLDDDGRARFKVKLPDLVRPHGRFELQLRASVTELGGRAVTAHGTVRVASRPFLIGLKRKNSSLAKPGRLEQFDCVVVDHDGKVETIDGVLSASLYRVSWNYVLEERNHTWRYVCKREEHKQRNFNVDVTAGRSRFSFAVDEVGSYMLLLSTDDGEVECDLSYYVSGNGSSPVDMSKPELVGMRLDKPKYKIGDTLRLALEAPFRGKLLVCVERQKVLHQQVFEMDGNAQELTLQVKPEWLPNVYISATVLRGFTGQVKGVPCRGFGVVPVVIDQSASRINVACDAPEEIKPDGELKARFTLTDAAGKPVQGELVVLAVDEGILSLTKFKNPDPWSFFTAKRRLEGKPADVYDLLMPEFERVLSDSVVGGGRGEKEMPMIQAKQMLSPIVADRVRNVALVKTGVMTDAQGRAEVTLDVPQFNGSLRLMAVAASSDKCGLSSQTVIVREPLMLKATLPRFLAPGDAFEIPVTIFNHTGADGAVTLRVNPRGLTVSSAAKTNFDLANGKEHTQVFKLTTPKMIGPVKVNLSARMGTHFTNRTVEIPVRPASSLVHESGAGRVEGGGSREIVIAPNYVEGTMSGRIVFSPSPMLKHGDSMKYLLDYPYGCLEQTTSRTLALIHLPELGKLVDPERFGADRIRDFVEVGIGRVLSMQLTNGGFSWWSGGEIYTWGTIYATSMLVEARDAGYAVDKDLLGLALDCVSDLLMRTDDYAMKAYACYVLARAGRPNRSWTIRLYEERNRLEDFSRYQLAVALHRIRERKMAAELIDMDALPDETVKSEYTGRLRSTVRRDAILLACFLDLGRNGPLVDNLAQRLSARMGLRRYYTTQNNAFALLALGRYTSRFTADDSYQAIVYCDGQPALKFGNDSSEQFSFDRKTSIKIEVKGGGSLFYHWIASGVSPKPDARQFDKKLKVRRRFCTRDGKPLNHATIKQGDLVIVELELSAPTTVPNVVVNDMLPAGLEIENPNLATRTGAPWLRKNGTPVANVDRRDDRLLLFTTASKEATYFRYAARVVTAGSFTLPAVHATCMYDPRIESRHGFDEITVKR